MPVYTVAVVHTTMARTPAEAVKAVHAALAKDGAVYTVYQGTPTVKADGWMDGFYNEDGSLHMKAVN